MLFFKYRGLYALCFRHYSLKAQSNRNEANQNPHSELEIQKYIVKRLDEAFSRIDSGTKHLKSAKDNLTKYKQSLLKSAFNGTLTNDSPLSQGESTAESSLRENPQGFLWQSTQKNGLPRLAFASLAMTKQSNQNFNTKEHK